MTIIELKRELVKNRDEARTLLDKEGRTPEDLEKAAELTSRCEEIQAEIEQREKLEGFNANIPSGKSKAATSLPNQPEVKGFKTLGEQLRSIANAYMGGPRDSRLVYVNDSGMELRAPTGMAESVPSAGGFLLQADFSQELFKRSYQTGILASRCRRIPISAASNKLVMNALDESSRATGSRLGGIQVYRANEAGTVTAKKPKFRQISLALEKMIGLCYATEELLEDVGALEAVVTDSFAEEFGYALDNEILRGTGAGQCLGILTSDALVTVAKESGQAADTVLTENIIKLYSRMYAPSRGNAIFLINQDIEPQLFTMVLAVGTGGVPVYMPAGGISGAPYGTLFGRDVVPIEQASTLGDKGDIVFADLSQYLLIDKGGVEASSSIHVQFLYGETVFRFVARNNGQPLWNTALTPAKGSNTLSPFVTLAERA